MPNLKDSISGFVAGDDLEIRRIILDIPSGQTLAKAWLTIKTAKVNADPGILQKIILPGDAPGTGQIEDTGADGTGVVRFDLTGANTLLLAEGIVYHFDIQVKTTPGNKIYTPVLGWIKAAGQVTGATS